MRILLAQDTYLPLVGGAEVHVANLSRALIDRGHEVEIVTCTPGPDEINGVRVHRFPRERSPPATAVWAARGVAPFVRLARRHDVIHAHYTYFMAAAFGAAARMLRKPFFTTLHGLNTLDSSVGGSKVKAFLRSSSLRASDRVFATSQEMREVAERFVEPARVLDMPNAVDVTRFDAIRRIELRPPPHVLILRRLTPKNGVQYLVEAAPRILKKVPEARFVIVGDGQLREHCERRARELGVSHAVSFEGAIPNHLIEPYLGAAHVVVFPSSAESTSIAALEAMAAGRPVVASAIGAFPDLLAPDRGRLVELFPRSTSDYDAPLMLPEDRLELLAEAVAETILDRKRAEAMSDAAFAYVREHHDWRVIAERIERVYAEVLERRGV